MQSEFPVEIRRHLAVIVGQAPGDLSGAIRALDHLAGAVGGHLGHYLRKRSYQKAWVLLAGGDPEAGTCAPHP